VDEAAFAASAIVGNTVVQAAADALKRRWAGTAPFAKIA